MKVEFFYDRGELLGGLTKGSSLGGSIPEDGASICPILNKAGKIFQSNEQP